MDTDNSCPCGTAQLYSRCCGPFHDASASLTTALQLMKSRYSAFVLGKVDYLISTTHPTKVKASLRKNILHTICTTAWTSLTILNTIAGSSADKTGKVYFQASYTEHGQEHIMTEHSRFRKLSGVWYYYDGKG